MSSDSANYLTGYLVRQAASCPLKLFYYRKFCDIDSGGGYKNETKKVITEAVSVRYPGGKRASGTHQKALEQTREWLQEENVTIYGGVVAREGFHARCPILVKRGNQILLIQVHGRIWRGGPPVVTRDSIERFGMTEYLREASYKTWLIESICPEWTVDVRFCFPSRDFHSDTDLLYQKVASLRYEPFSDQLQNLFVEVPAGPLVGNVINSDLSLPCHPFFQQVPFVEQIRWMLRNLRGQERAPFQITRACTGCDYRIGPEETAESGCWNDHLSRDVDQPDLHVFDLIGHGNREAVSGDIYFQERAEPPSGYDSLEAVLDQKQAVITMDQRRALQILSARGERVPAQWLKTKLVQRIQSLARPLHFIDFEAASTLIPMSAGSSCYEVVLFQFSCHTLTEGGELNHTQWVDEEPSRHPHPLLVNKLLEIPDISRGTIVHYSPFEKQALERLARELESEQYGGSEQPEQMRRIIAGTETGQSDRYLDLSRFVRDFYFNSAMRNGLSLKSVLKSLLESSREVREYCSLPLEISDKRFIFAGHDEVEVRDPYRLIQTAEERIGHGVEAMHAWLYTKTPHCGEEKREEIFRALRRYCTMDTMAMVILLRFWEGLIRSYEPGHDLILMDPEAHQTE
ncbi:MAG: DUF2779 domain-containing protein [Balneolaceae bacterium]